jgi:glycine/D-amino acid oxidase-like deaminating enzyme
VVVIGSGIGGLSCAAMLAKYGFKARRGRRRLQQAAQPFCSQGPVYLIYNRSDGSPLGFCALNAAQGGASSFFRVKEGWLN